MKTPGVMICLFVALLAVSGCGAPAETPTPTPIVPSAQPPRGTAILAPVATDVLPTPAPSAQPPRATATLAPTATEVPLTATEPSPTETSAPPTETFEPPTATPVPATPEPPTETPPEAPRPDTGLLGRYIQEMGRGELLIKNGTDGDGVVILATAGDVPAQAAYIRAGESFQMAEIADGAYRLYFSKGDGWDAAGKAFIRNVTRQRFEDTFAFETTETQYTGYEVTLYGVADGNAATEDVDAEQFPALQ